MKKKLNERNTENIVRLHFQNDKLFKEITFEEQSSNNPQITKLLKNASKQGIGIGRPEFIITVNDEDNLVIVIECKADILNHESKDRNNPSKYAVDGALHYSSFLSKKYNVLSIAVSGNEYDMVTVSYFYQKIGGQSEQIFGNNLISIDDIISGLRKDKVKRNQKYDELLQYSGLLNKDLHKLKIKEDKRSLLVSGILIALRNKDFFRSYKEAELKFLPDNLVNTIKTELKIDKLGADKIDLLMNNYNFIKQYPNLIKKHKNNELKDLKQLINEIDDNINGYTRTYKYYDVLGQFYIEFLRYSNDSKGLGIVLTPPHITEFFCDIVNLQSDDIVFDNCTGTGGFLISSMKKMIEKCDGDQKKEENIKKNQLIGIEFQPEIFPLAVSNMILHGDGKSNIIDGDCFDEKIIKYIKSKKPTVGFLNPPYKSDKDDHEEFDFILNSLDCLEKNGRCVAIVPLSCAIKNDKERLRLKKKLLSKHTLEGVFSMPDELFYNSKVGTNTCIMVFTAHIPHPERKKTFFGYFKDDGFYKKRTRSRYDYDNIWPNIKNDWLNLYINKIEKSGMSVSNKVIAEDEWCAEQFIKMNYNELSIEDFKQNVRDYLSYNVKQGIFDKIKKFLDSNNPESLDTSKWKDFKLEEIFEISLGKPIHSKSIKNSISNYNKGYLSYVTRSAENNGIEMYVSEKEIEDKSNYIQEGNCITVGAEGFTAFYQQNSFITGNKVNILRNDCLENENALFINAVLNFEIGKKFGYGRGCVQKRLKDLLIKLPVKENKVDYNYMSEFIKSLKISKDN